MTDREIMEALLRGETLVCQLTTRFTTLMMSLEGDKVTVLAGGVAYRAPFEETGVWRIQQPPNPHTNGTFAWAVEECRRGRKVTCGNFGEYTDLQEARMIDANLALAVDWEVVP